MLDINKKIYPRIIDHYHVHPMSCKEWFVSFSKSFGRFYFIMMLETLLSQIYDDPEVTVIPDLLNSLRVIILLVGVFFC